MCVSHFPLYSGFLTIFQLLLCEFLIFFVFPVFHYIPGPIMCISHFSPFFRFSPHISRLKVCVSHFALFLLFSPYSRSYRVHFSFNMFLSVSRHIQGPTVCVSHFTCFQCFVPYSRSYSVCVSFSKFFSFLAIFQVL